MSDLAPIFLILAAMAPLMLLLALRFPAVFMILAFALTPFQQALIGEDSPVVLGVVDVVAALLLLPLCFKFLKDRRLTVGPVSWAVLYFLVIAFISTSAAGLSVSGIVSLVRMVMNTLIPILIFANLSVSKATFYRCYMAFLIACNVLSLCSLYAFATGGIEASMYTLGLHKNFIGPLLGCGVCVAVISLMNDSARGRNRAWLVATLIFASIGLLFSLSRGGWLATVLGLLLIMCMTRNVRAILVSVALGAVTMGIAWQFLPAERTEYATDISSDAHTAQTRLDTIAIVARAFESSPIVGVGVELRKEVEPHDVLVLTAGEMGVLGIIGFVLMFCVAFGTIFMARKQLKLDPVANSITAMAAAVLCVALADGILDVYWRRGIGFMSWAGVGMVMHLLAAQKLPRRTPAMPISRMYGRNDRQSQSLDDVAIASLDRSTQLDAWS